MQDNIIFAIVVHSKQIIELFESSQRYKDLKNYVYILVGIHNEDYTSDKIIQCDRLMDNIEDNKNYLAYTGWYAVAKNLNLIGKQFKYIYFLEYDTNITEPSDLKTMIFNIFEGDKKVYGFHAFELHSCFLDNSIFNSLMVSFLKEKGYRSVRGNNNNWMATNNMVFERNFLVDFFNDEMTIDFLKYLKNDKMSGHNLERYLSVYCFLKNVQFDFVNPNCFKHEAMDSHNTQGRNNVYEGFKTVNKISD